MLNENILKGKWKEIKGEIQKAWGNISGDDMDKASGNVKSLAGLVQKKYGLAQSEAEQKINSIIARFGDSEKDESSDKQYTRQNPDSYH